MSLAPAQPSASGATNTRPANWKGWIKPTEDEDDAQVAKQEEFSNPTPRTGKRASGYRRAGSGEVKEGGKDGTEQGESFLVYLIAPTAHPLAT